MAPLMGMLEGEGSLAEGERSLGVVSYQVVRGVHASGIPFAYGSISALPDIEVMLDLRRRNALLTLTFPGGCWDCRIQLWTPGVGVAHVTGEGPPTLDH